MRILPLALLAALTVACSGPQATSVPTAASAAPPQGSEPGAGQASAPTAEQVAAAKQTLAAALPATVPAEAIARIAAGLRSFGPDLQIARVEVGPDGVVNAPAGADVLVIKTSDTAQTKVIPPAGARAIVFEGAGGVSVTFDDRPAQSYRVADADAPADVTVTVNASAAAASDQATSEVVEALKKDPNVEVKTDNGTTTATLSGVPILTIKPDGEVITPPVQPPSDRVVALPAGKNELVINDDTNSNVFASGGTNSIQIGGGFTSVNVGSGTQTTIVNPKPQAMLSVTSSATLSSPVIEPITNQWKFSDGNSSLQFPVVTSYPVTVESNNSLYLFHYEYYSEVMYLQFLIEDGSDYYDWVRRREYTAWSTALRHQASLSAIVQAMLQEPAAAALVRLSDQELIDRIVTKTDLIRSQDLKANLQKKLQQGMSRTDLLIYVVSAWARGFIEYEAQVVVRDSSIAPIPTEFVSIEGKKVAVLKRNAN